MYTKHFFQSSILISAGLATHIVQACPIPETSDQYRGVYNISLLANEAKLISVYQYDTDLEIFIDSQASFSLNAPGQKYSPDFIFLDENIHGSSVELCFKSVYQHAAQGSYSIEEYSLDITSIPNESYAKFQQLNTASELWRTQTAQNMQTSAELYNEIASSMPFEFQKIPQLEFYTRYFPAMAYTKIRNFEKAESSLNKLNLSNSNQHKDSYKAALLYGRILVRKNKHQDALPYMDEALRLFLERQQQTGDNWPFERAEIILFLTESYTVTRRLDETHALLDSIRNDVGIDFAMNGRLHSSLAFLHYYELLFLEEAENNPEPFHERILEEIEEAIYFSAAANDREILQVIENNAAVFYNRAGETRKSLQHAQRVLSIMETIDNEEFGTLLFSNLGRFAMDLGDYDSALAYLQKSIEFSENMNDTQNENTYCLQGTLYRISEKTNLALEQHKECYDRALEAGNTTIQADALLQISIDYIALGDLYESESSIRDSITLLPNVSNIRLKMQAWTQLATVLYEQAKFSDAKTAIQTALNFDKDNRLLNAQVDAWEMLMRIEQALGNLDELIVVGTEAINTIENVHVQLEAERLGPSWGAVTEKIFDKLVTVQLGQLNNTTQSALSDIIELSERSRDISLRQRLGSTLQTDSISLEEQSRISLFSKISNEMAMAGKSQPAPEPVNADYYFQHNLLSLARLNKLETIPIPAPLSVSSIQEQLSKQQIVFYYLVSNNKLQLFTISTQAINLVKSVPMKDVEKLLENIQQTLNQDRQLAISNLQKLSALILPPTNDYAFADEIMLVPHNGLHALPFSALSTRGLNQDYIPLIDSHSLKILPSLNSYFMFKPVHNTDYSTDVAILADPVFENLQFSYLETSLAKTDTLRGWANSLAPLPYTALEARNIQDTFPEKHIVYTREQASRKNLFSPAVRNAQVLHLATHGYFKSTSEDNIGLAMSTRDTDGNPVPGFLTLTELFGYQFNNQLVVISGCDTAMGKEHAGLGMNGLTRGFLSQGVKQVISTLWEVSDRASAEFMGLFYSYLRENENPALSLQLAQNKLRQSSDYNNPFYWATYIITSVDNNNSALFPE